MNQKVAVSVVYVSALFMAIMDTTIVNVALPTIGRDFHTHPDAVDTVVIGFLVSLAVFIPTSGWLGDRFGSKRVLLAAIVVFTAASALCGLAANLSELVIFRVIQGAGGGLMTPVGMAMLWRTFPPAERVRASSIIIIPTALAPTIGPVLGGLFVTEISWRWVFYVNVPIGVAAVVFGSVFLAEHPEERPGRFDLAGFLLAGIGLGLLMYGVSEGPIRGWGRSSVVAGCVGGALLLAALIVAELHRREPLIDLGLFRNRLFSSSTTVMFVGAGSFLGMLYLVALFFQDGLGLSAQQSGLSTFPEALGVMLGTQVVTRLLYPVVGPRRVIIGGLGVLAVPMASMTFVGFGTSLWVARGLLFVMGVGMSGVFIPAQTAAFATMSGPDTGRASTLFNTQRQLGSAVGVAILTTVVAAAGPYTRQAGHTVSNLGAYHDAFVTAALLAVAAAGAALAINDADAAETMVRRGRPRRGEAGAPADAKVAA
ncbi:MAG TPA: MDR family MFS transporter [Acidimicrobiales bacterium]|nr:MDR family MFS transporter [Acidimicrobiales bacterium]